MGKLQDYIDTVFGQRTTEHTAWKPDQVVLERERAFEEKSRKIEALRRARLEHSSKHL